MSAGRPVNGGGQQAKPATAARIYDYFLGGTHNFPADREAAKAIVDMFPSTIMAAKVNRAFMRRAVNYVSEMGVSQFLDIGSGIPTEGNVHEIAQTLNPKARVVYVDIDPVAVGESQEMLDHNNLAIAIRGDAREPRAILEHPQVRKLLDFDQPIAVMLVALLHFINDDDEAHRVVREFVEAVPPGSYLVVSHVIDETAADWERFDDIAKVRDVYKRQTAAQLRMRTRAEVAGFLEGLELVEPGVAWVWDWRPAPGEEFPTTSTTYSTGTGGIAGVVGRITGK